MSRPALIEDAVEEILLRFPPDDPAPLFRAAVVCKAWCRLISGAAFHRRFHELHRGALPPLLGLIRLRRGIVAPQSINDKIDFTPTSSTFRPPASLATISGSWPALDALHGRILFWDRDRLRPWECAELVAWRAIADEVRRLPMLHLPKALSRWTATLLCGGAAAAGYHHNQQDCSSSDDDGGAFTVVLVHTNIMGGAVSVYVYSSEHDVWSKPVSIYEDHDNNLFVIAGSTALVGKVVYFPCIHNRTTKLLGYDLCKQQASFVNLPPPSPRNGIALTTAGGDQGDRLGLAMAGGGKLFTWSRKAAAGCDDDDDGWTQERVFELDKMLLSWVFSLRHYLITPVVGNNNGVFIVTAQDALFTIDLKTGGVTKRLDVRTAKWSISIDDDFVAYRYFYIPRFVCAPPTTINK